MPEPTWGCSDEKERYMSYSPVTIGLASKISYVFVPQVWSITLLLLERISPHSDAKIGNISGMVKEIQNYFCNYTQFHFQPRYFQTSLKRHP